MAARYLIEGGVPLKGKVYISGAKNAAIKEIAASLLTTGTVTLSNIPEIADVAVDLEIVKALGAEVSKPQRNVLVLRSPEKLRTAIPAPLSGRSRAAIITMGPLLAREGAVSLPTPGGCPIGERPLDRHLAALESLGASFEVTEGTIKGWARKLTGGRIVFKKNTVMGTENAILAAVLAEGETEIAGAAMEPEVDDLILLLGKMGARIEREVTDPRVVRVQGARSLSGAKHTVIPDRIEVVTFAIAAIITSGDLTLAGLEISHLTAFLAKLEKVGARYAIEDSKTLRVGREVGAPLLPTDITTAPHPGFMTDWQQPFTLLLSQTQGESLIHETVYEDRWSYLSELKKFGVQVKLFTPSELGKPFNPEEYNFDWQKKVEPKVYAKVFGPAMLAGAKVTVGDLRAGATLVLAALAAEGKSEVSGIEHLERGYENFEEKLTSLGALIRKRKG